VCRKRYKERFLNVQQSKNFSRSIGINYLHFNLLFCSAGRDLKMSDISKTPIGFNMHVRITTGNKSKDFKFPSDYYDKIETYLEQLKPKYENCCNDCEIRPICIPEISGVQKCTKLKETCNNYGKCFECSSFKSAFIGE
jgi:hypothetical protein